MVSFFAVSRCLWSLWNEDHWIIVATTLSCVEWKKNCVMHPEVNLGIFWLTIFKVILSILQLWDHVFSSKKTRLSTSMTWCRKHVLPIKIETFIHIRPKYSDQGNNLNKQILCRQNKKLFTEFQWCLFCWTCSPQFPQLFLVGQDTLGPLGPVKLCSPVPSGGVFPSMASNRYVPGSWGCGTLFKLTLFYAL